VNELSGPPQVTRPARVGPPHRGKGLSLWVPVLG